MGVELTISMTRPMEYVGVPDIPEGMTLPEYRRLRCAAPAAKTLRARALSRLRRRPREAYASTSPRRIA